MDRYKAALAATVVASLAVMAAVLAFAPTQTPEKKGPALVAVEIDFNGYGPTNETSSYILVPVNTGDLSPDFKTEQSRFFGNLLPRNGESHITILRGGVEYWYYSINHTDGLDLGFLFELENGTVYDATVIASSILDLNVKSEWYPNFRSHRVTEIAGVKDGTDGRYWQYYVNGVYMGTGADQTGLKDGDVVRWEFRSAMQ